MLWKVLPLLLTFEQATGTAMMTAEDGYDLELLRKDPVGGVVVVSSFDPFPQR